MNSQNVLNNSDKWSVDTSDNLTWMRSLPSDSCALCITSPPYLDCRSYGINFALEMEEWVAWMKPRVVEMCRIVDGMVCINMSAPVKNFSYQPGPEVLVADLVRGHGIVCAASPYIYFRFGIPGSGSLHYHRRDNELIYCFAKPESLPLKWSDNTAFGIAPKYAKGGDLSYRSTDGTRKNQKCWSAAKDGSVKGSHTRNIASKKKIMTKKRDGQHSQESTEYEVPDVSNPGNVLKETYDAERVRQLLMGGGEKIIEGSAGGDVIRCLAGGGNMGDSICHENEAPFSETLARFFILSYAPVGSIVLEPFLGSGTTVKVAVEEGRRSLGCDIRQSQVDICTRRMMGVTQTMFPA